MQAWTGWTATSAPGVKTALTWNEWCACQQGVLGGEKPQLGRQQQCMPFNNQELARLSFVRWLYQTGRLDTAQISNV